MAGSGVLSADTIRHFAKVGVEGSNPFARSSFPKQFNMFLRGTVGVHGAAWLVASTGRPPNSAFLAHKWYFSAGGSLLPGRSRNASSPTHLSGGTPQHPENRSGADDALFSAKPSALLPRARRFDENGPAHTLNRR